MDNYDIELIRRMNEYIKANEEKRVNSLKIKWTDNDSKRVKEILDDIKAKESPFERDMAERYTKFDSYKELKNTSKEWETTVSVDCEGSVEIDDYYSPLNILYAQLATIQSEIFMGIKQRNFSDAEDKWKKITEMLVDSYNMAAKSTTYRIQYTK